jgi:hypothetical protein
LCSLISVIKENKRSKSQSPFRRVDPDQWINEVKSGLENNSCKSFLFRVYLFLILVLTFCLDENTFGDGGYGAKANKVLATVRGKDFRHEKTKRKRSTYRGGLISLESKSFKYDDN